MSMWAIIRSTTSVAAYSVECLGLNPYWLPERSFAFSRYADSWLYMIFSITFEMTGRRDMGLYLLNVALSPFFNIGMTLATFSLFGNVPE